MCIRDRFEYFPNSIGVANLETLKHRLTSEPAYITLGSAGTGFAEVANALLAARD